ncbi:MAG: hypothetical protein KIT80_14955 [Chitinophagaceae bacterium]|nr:hypothetical protein [Chitinophagaceae bacterium]MCH5685218.1 hypothetical protein [Niabella sp. W65]MCH7363721.1 hypothetical protein [Niabella sp. W65]MCW5928212.1 hypothetical protein [Chitinophagaceae bacterium]ULT39632.1 hypothetical protein KRR40_32585 [Niabella sp. I65]
MEKLFERNNIGYQLFVDEDGQDIHFAYTDKLLALNVLIEFYTAVTDGSEENYEEETVVAAITYTEKCSYSFALFHSTNVIGPLLLYRIVADAVHFIEQSGKTSLLEDLAEISTGGTTSDVMDNKADRKRVYDSDVWRFTSVLDLIKQKR